MNIRNPHETTIRQFAEEIIEYTGTVHKVIYVTLPKDDPTHRQPDITKAKEILGWEPKVRRSEALIIVYDYFKSLSEEDLQKRA